MNELGTWLAGVFGIVIALTWFALIGSAKQRYSQLRHAILPAS